MRTLNNEGRKTSEFQLTAFYLMLVTVLMVIGFERSWDMGSFIDVIKVITPVILVYGGGRQALKGVKTYKGGDDVS